MDTMPKIETDPIQVSNNMEVLYSMTDEHGSGITDAIAHIGLMMAGEMDALTVQDVQDELLESDPDGPYTKGYIRTWNRIDRLIADEIMELTPNRH